MAERNKAPRKQEEKDNLCKKTITIKRVTKVVKGGRKMRFAAMVVVGDQKGKVGCGMGKANEVPVAIEKATAQAKRAMRQVALDGNTITHRTIGKFGKGSIVMIPAEEGTGVLAGGPVRAVMEAVGIKNIRTKSHGSTNAVNMAKAAIAGLYGLMSIEDVAALRGKTVEELKD